MSGDMVKSDFFGYEGGEKSVAMAWMRRVLFDIAAFGLQSTPDRIRGTAAELMRDRRMLGFYVQDLSTAIGDAESMRDEVRRAGMVLAQTQVAAVLCRAAGGDGWRGLAAEITDIRGDEFQHTYDEGIAAGAKA